MEVQATFDFYPIGENDWHTIKTFCVRLLDNTVWDLGAFADLAIRCGAQVGSTLKIGDEATDVGGVSLSTWPGWMSEPSPRLFQRARSAGLWS